MKIHALKRILLPVLFSSFAQVHAAAAEATPPAALASARSAGEEVINFALLDQYGRYHEFRRAGTPVVVLLFTASECPMTRNNVWKLKSLWQRYADRGVTFWMISSNPADDRAKMLKQAEALRSDPIPILKDDTQGVARMLAVDHTCESVAISVKDGRIFYRGAIDGEEAAGATKQHFSEKYLELALDEFLSGKQVSRTRTVAKGTPIPFAMEALHGGSEVSFATEIAPILIRKCVVCHRPGDIGSWVMSDYKKVKGMSDMMQEVLLAQRMPPWGADPHFGKFANDRSLTIAEAQTLLRWIEEGAPRGQGDDPLPGAAVPAADWPLGPPDYILRLPGPEQIPATGLVNLRHRIVSAPFTNDVWISALDFKPGNRRVLHHIGLRTVYPGQTVPDPVPFTGWNPGYMSRRFPEGTAMHFTKDVKFHLDLHYTTIGTPQSDQTEIGFYVRRDEPRAILDSRAAWNADLSIPPGEANLKTFALTGFDRDTLLYDFRPHMHYRGSWFQYELLYPNGTREVLLSVPRYDFNWQTTYVLAEPKRVPAGTWMLCRGGFDNSRQNPSNPDPAKRVSWGEQSWDEMFIGHFSAAVAP